MSLKKSIENVFFINLWSEKNAILFTFLVEILGIDKAIQ